MSKFDPPLSSRLPAWTRDRPSRLDRGRMYMCVMLGVWVCSLAVMVVGPIPSSGVSSLSQFTQDALAFVMLMGSSACVWGFSRGTRWIKPSMMHPSTIEDIRDLQHSYSAAIVGVPAVTASLGTYIWAIASHTQGFWLSVLGVSISLSIIIGSIWNAWDFRNEIQRLDALSYRIGEESNGRESKNGD